MRRGYLSLPYLVIVPAFVCFPFSPPQEEEKDYLVSPLVRWGMKSEKGCLALRHWIPI